MIPTASSVASLPGKVRDEGPAEHVRARDGSQEDLDREREHDRPDEPGDQGLAATEAAFLERQHAERDDGRHEPRHEQRHVEEDREPERGADELREVGRHRDRLGLEPEEDDDRPREAVAADLGEVLSGRDPELRRERLDEHRHQVRREHDPEERVAELRAGCDVRREVAGIDVRDRRDEGRPRKGRSARNPRRCPERERSAAASTRASPGNACSAWTSQRSGLASWGTLRAQVTPIPSASSREIACSAFPMRTVSGPPKGSARLSFTFLPGMSASLVR